MKRWIEAGFLVLVVLGTVSERGAAFEEWRVKRKKVFEFAERPRLTRQGDHVTIRFAAKDFCDVTIAIERADGQILRFLGSGVLGDNAPPPFKKNALAQTIVWDGKDEQGRYVDDKDNCVVRVSLGLKPRFEKTLYWDPRRRVGSGGSASADSILTHPVPLMVPAPEGVYVFEGRGTDHLRLFDHDGHYVRTIYPFPADQITKVKGLEHATYPQDGLNLPVKTGYQHQTFLKSGLTSSWVHEGSRDGTAAVAMAVQGSQIAILQNSLNRLATDGSTGGLMLYGPKVTFPADITKLSKKGRIEVSPRSAALSPDGRHLYLTGYVWRAGIHANYKFKDGLHGVVRMDFEKNDPPVLFAGSMKQGEAGSGADRFTDPVSVACDAKGRVYVADYMNDRIQVFMQDGKPYKTLPTRKPARIQVHPRTGEIYVFSWAIQNDSTLGKQAGAGVIEPTFTTYGPIESPERRRTLAIPFAGYIGKCRVSAQDWGGIQFSAVFDPWANPPALWVVNGKPSMDYVSSGGMLIADRSTWDAWNIRVYSIVGGKLEAKRDFAAEVSKTVQKHDPPKYQRQRLYWNPKSRKLCVGEIPLGAVKSFSDMVEVDPDNGTARMVALPMDSEDIAFDMDGLIYMRSLYELARYDTTVNPWREVPFDYGEERNKISFSQSTDRRADVISCIPLYTGTYWHKGGIWVSPKGHIAISCYSTKDLMPHFDKRTDEKRMGGEGNAPKSDPKEDEKVVKGNVYEPRFFPGRNYYGQIHVFDRNGKRVYDDEVPGIAITDGLFIDRDDSIYVMAGSTRIIDGKPYFSDFTGTLMKFRQGQGRIVSTESRREPIPLTVEPGRPPDIRGNVQGKAWVEDAEWLYGGVGFAGRAAGALRMGGHTCACNNSRFALDYFARSFAPEYDRYRVAVLDTNGNLILRLGQYGNVDDGKPLVAAGGPPHARSIGGDETAFFHPLYLATETDKRLFVADPGNARIVSVKLEYHHSETLALKEVPDEAADRNVLGNPK